jgi:hypothetical protein
MGSDPVSFEATKWVMENSPYTGGTFTVHLVMAHIANELNDWQIWMTQQHLAEKARVTERTVRTVQQQMIEDRYLEKVLFRSEVSRKWTTAHDVQAAPRFTGNIFRH